MSFLIKLKNRKTLIEDISNKWLSLFIGTRCPQFYPNPTERQVVYQTRQVQSFQFFEDQEQQHYIDYILQAVNIEQLLTKDENNNIYISSKK